MKDGQIYRWRWADAKRDADNAPYRSYHCKSGIAIVNGGRLFDTFWSDPTDGFLRREDVTLTLLCDQSWPTISEWEVHYYDRSDIADTRHSNNSRAPIYLRPGAKKSEAAITQEIDYREEKARSDIRSAEWRLEELAKSRALLLDGKIDEVRL